MKAIASGDPLFAADQTIRDGTPEHGAGMSNGAKMMIQVHADLAARTGQRFAKARAPDRERRP
jgi:hypothetical protein